MTDTSPVARILACIAASIGVAAALAPVATAAPPCSGLVTKAQIAHIVGLAHVSTAVYKFQKDECPFEAWKSGSMPRGHEYRKKLEAGSVAEVAIVTPEADPEAEAQDKPIKLSLVCKLSLERQLSQRATTFSPPAYGAEEVCGAFVQEATERSTEAIWNSASMSKSLEVNLIHTVAKPATAESEVDKIAAIAVPAFGL